MSLVYTYDFLNDIFAGEKVVPTSFDPDVSTTPTLPADAFVSPDKNFVSTRRPYDSINVSVVSYGPDQAIIAGEVFYVNVTFEGPVDPNDTSSAIGVVPAPVNYRPEMYFDPLIPEDWENPNANPGNFSILSMSLIDKYTIQYKCIGVEAGTVSAEVGCRTLKKVDGTAVDPVTVSVVITADDVAGAAIPVIQSVVIAPTEVEVGEEFTATLTFSDPVTNFAQYQIGILHGLVELVEAPALSDLGGTSLVYTFRSRYTSIDAQEAISVTTADPAATELITTKTGYVSITAPVATAPAIVTSINITPTTGEVSDTFTYTIHFGSVQTDLSAVEVTYDGTVLVEDTAPELQPGGLTAVGVAEAADIGTGTVTATGTDASTATASVTINS